MVASERDYDPSDPASIEAYAKRLVGHCLRDMLPLDEQITYQSGVGKGGLGDLVERGYFGINPGNISQPDFTEAGVELKTTPAKRVGKRLRAKERRRAADDRRTTWSAARIGRTVPSGRRTNSFCS